MGSPKTQLAESAAASTTTAEKQTPQGPGQAGAAIAALPAGIEFGREICGDLRAAEQREWLVTNGIGGFASGTIAGLNTRRYHGLLMAALNPPLGRTLLAAQLHESIEYDGARYALGTSRWKGGTISPAGYLNVERFRLNGTTPIWELACGDALIEKRVWMEQGSNTTYVRYEVLRSRGAARLELKALVNYRDYHSTTHAGDWRMNIERVPRGLRVTAFAGARPCYIFAAGAEAEAAHDWYRNCDLAAERERGLDDTEDLLHAGTLRVTLEPGRALTVVLSTEADASLDGTAALARREAHEQALLNTWAKSNPREAARAPEWIRQLVLAADQFIVDRALKDDPNAKSVIAGYPWFGDWGRDTMIALPGLTLATGRPEIAKKVLATFARFVDQGSLPNLFPDAGSAPEYNTADAVLWMFEAVRQYFTTTQDKEFLGKLYPVLREIVDWHLNGAISALGGHDDGTVRQMRYTIRVDPADGLLFAGEAGVQLTWMDAKVGDWVVTPRIGKCVELNALWHNALAAMIEFARALKQNTTQYEFLARRVRTGFDRFWNESAKCLYDVIDGPQGNEAAIRPNQIFAVSLAATPLSEARQRAVLDAVACQLLTSNGLRSLAPGGPAYIGRYQGGPRERDGAYHQGTVWSWLLGPFVAAHLRLYGNPAQAASYLEPMAQHLHDATLGSISEIFDGDAPFMPRGCTAQAWSVAEVLRAWHACVQ